MIFSPPSCPPPPSTPPGDAWVRTNQVILFLVPSLVVCAYAAWYALRRETRIVVRSWRVNVMLTTGMLFCLAGVTVRRAFPGRVPCGLWSIVLFQFVPLMTCSAAARLFVSIAQSLRAEAAVAFLETDERASQSEVVDDSYRFFQDMVTLVVKGKTVVVGNNGMVSASTFRFLRSAGTSRNLIKLLLMFYAPAVVIIVILVATVNPYHEACAYCPFYFELYIGMCVYASLFVSPFFPLMWQFRATKDPTGLYHELLIALLFAGLAGVGWLLLPFDIGYVEEGDSFTLEYIGLLGCVLIWVAWTPAQLVLALADRYQRRRYVAATKHKELEDAVVDEETYSAFLAFAEKTFVVESVRFIHAVVSWKQVYFEKTEELRVRRAKAIAKVYLQRHGGLEINVSDESREQVLVLLARGDVQVSLFDRALRETGDMLRFTVWVDFQRQLEADERAAHGDLKAKRVSAYVRGGGI